MARLVASFLTLSLLTVLFVALVAFYESRKALSEAMFARLKAIALEEEAGLNRLVELHRRMVVFLAELPEVRADVRLLTTGTTPRVQEAARGRLSSLLASASRAPLDVNEIFVLSPIGGKVIASTNADRLGDYRVSDLFYTRGKIETFVQNVYTSPVTGRPVLTISSPVKGEEGVTLAVIAAHLNLGYVDRLVSDRTGLGSTGEAYLVSSFNDVVSSERFGSDEYRRGVFSPGIEAALHGEDGVGVYANYAGVPVIGAYRWNEDRQLALLVEVSQREAFGPARRLVATILGIGIASALVLAGGVVFIARQIARPILAITEAATRVADGDFSTVAPVLTNDEVGVLAKAFNEMTARLRTLYVDLNDQVDATISAMVALEQSQHLLQAIIDNSTTLIAVTDPAHRFLLLNKSFESVLGASQADALHKTPGDFLSSDVATRLENAAKSAFGEKRVAEIETEIEVTGETRTYIFVCFPLLGERSAAYGVGIVANDLTEIKRAEMTHLHLEAQVQHAQKLEGLGLMAGGIAHDFNNILTSVLGNSELAQQSMPMGSKTRHHIDKVIAATKQAAHLTHQMLAYAGKASFHQEIFDLNTVLGELTELIKASISKKITLRTELDAKPAIIQANRAQLTQLIMNLVTNAAEAVGDRPGHVTVETERYESASGFSGPAVSLTVSDDGCGMDRATRARIFDPFFSTKGAGRGIGLAAAVGIVESSGGRMSVVSESGRGSTFEVVFPAHEALRMAIGELSDDERAASGRGTILVVDDEPMVREAATSLLEAAGYCVIEAADGLEAVSIFRRQWPEIDAVLLDMTMPGMGGAEALHELRAVDASASVILTSGYDERDSVANLNHEERVDFLQKPYRCSTLLTKLSRVLAGRERAQVSGTSRS
jgi:PAS domain S-box-containing protein